MEQKRLYELDIIRFLAALMVVFFHFNVDSLPKIKSYLVDNILLKEVIIRGNLGVQLFFIISGFVILMSAQQTNATTFLKSRALRLYPAFIPMCLFTFLIGKLFINNYIPTFTDLLINLTLLGTFASQFGVRLISGVYWTLIIEMQFYFFIFLLIYFDKIKFIRIFLIAWLTLSILTYFGENYFNTHHLFNKIRMLFITEHSFYFIAGCYYYLIKYNRQKLDILMPAIILIFSLICFQNHNNNYFSFLTASILSSFFILFYFVALKGFNITKNTSLIVILGNLTYPLYLIHEEFGNILIDKYISYFDKTVFFIIVVWVMVAITYLFNIYVEKPFSKWLKNLLKMNSTSQLALIKTTKVIAKFNN